MTEFEEVMKDRLGESWFKVHQDDVNSEWFKKIATWVAYQRNTFEIYPVSEDVFRAYKLCPYDQTKVVILGLDPYVDGSANGLAFGYKDGIKASGRKKSLDVIFQELETDIMFGLFLEQDYELSYLAKQGVMLLNTVLTVQRNVTNSHADIKKVGWQNFTGKSIAYLLESKQPKVFMLWGNNAQDLFWLIVEKFKIQIGHHLILEAKHPASDIYNVDKFGDIKPDYPNTFLGCRHFSKCNEFLRMNQMEQITW